MNTYNYNPYREDFLNTYPNTNLNYRQATIPNQYKVPQGNNMESENSYAEHILNQNKGKNIKIYMSFSDSLEWRDRIFEGTLEAWGKDFILLKQNDNLWYMVWNIYIDFIEFTEPVVF